MNTSLHGAVDPTKPSKSSKSVKPKPYSVEDWNKVIRQIQKDSRRERLRSAPRLKR